MPDPEKPRSPLAIVRLWRIIVALMLAGVCVYYAFGAINTLGLAERQAVATVLGKQYYPPRTTYETMNIGGRNYVKPYQTAESWVLSLRLNGEETSALVEKSLYDTLNSGDEVQASYKRLRFTGATRVVRVRPLQEKGDR